MQTAELVYARATKAAHTASVILLLLGVTACGSGAYSGLAEVVKMPTESMTADQSSDTRRHAVRLSRAATCAARADELATQASWHRGLDLGLLVGAAAIGVAGTILGAIAIAFNDDEDEIRRSVLAVGAGLSAGSAGVFGLRAALDFGDLGRREREAAARMAGLALDAAYVSSDAAQMQAAYAAAQDCTSADVDAVRSTDEEAVMRLIERLRPNSSDGGSRHLDSAGGDSAARMSGGERRGMPAEVEAGSQPRDGDHSEIGGSGGAEGGGETN